MREILKFMILSYLTAFLFENIAFIEGSGRLYIFPLWPIAFLLYYGLLYSVTFVIFRDKKIIYPILFFAVLGAIIEIFLMKRFNWIDPIIYAAMIFIPFYLYKKNFNFLKFTSQKKAHPVI